MAITSTGSSVMYHARAPPGLVGAMKNPYVLMCCLTAAIGGFSFGYDQGVVSVILVMPAFLTRFSEIDATVSSNAGFYKGLATSMLELGGVLGALTNSWVADKFSRRRAMQVGVVVFVVGAIIQTTSQDYATLTVGRFIGGFGVGMLAMVAPVYMGEISPAEIRGSLLVLEEWFIVVGLLVQLPRIVTGTESAILIRELIAFWITYGTRFIDSEWSFRLPFVLQIIPALYLGFAVIWMPPSPRWLCQKGRDVEALAVLSRLRQLPQDDPNVQAELIDIQVEAQFQRQVMATHHKISNDRRDEIPVLKDLAEFLNLFKANCRKRTMVGVALVFFQQFVGINALIYYAPTIFSSIGLSYERSLLMSGIMNIIQLVGVTASIPLMDRLGRKPLLMFGAIGMLASQLCLAILVGLYSDSWPSHSAQGWVGVAFIWWYMIAFGISWGPVPWSMPAEIFPSSLRSKGTAFSQACQWFFNFVIGLVTPPMIQNIGYGTYAFFSVFCVLSFLWSLFFAPETKQKSLEEMDAVFGDHMGEHDERSKAAIGQDLMHANPAEESIRGSDRDEKYTKSDAFVESV